MDKQLVLTRETHGATAQDQMEPSSPSSSAMLASQQKNLQPLSPAEPDADVNQMSESLTVSRHSWGQENPGRQTTVSTSLLEHLFINKIKSLPSINILHVTWKNLLADLESPTATHTPTSVMLKLKEAITEENDDWEHVTYFLDNCEDEKKLSDIDLDALSEALYRIVGIDAHHDIPWIALREIDEDLADEIFTFCHLANKVQRGELLFERLPCLRDLAVGLYEILWGWGLAEIMDELLKDMEAKVLGLS